jgi:valyl-tRNA synthetase
MTVPVSQRSGAVIEPRLSNQWFLAVNKNPASGGDSIAAKAIAAVHNPANGKGVIKITPEMYAKTYHEWMSNIHDWCLSRQLWWGHRIPAWHCGACGHITVARTAPERCSNCQNSSELEQDPDVLDTWFSSGLLPFTVFGWPEVRGLGGRVQGVENTARGALHPTPYSLHPDYSFYPTTLLVTGFDILFFWVARMIMLGTHFMLDVPNADGSQRQLAEAVPFREVYIHGLIRDAGGQKMSKTKGNVVDPIDIINRFGTDAVRFTLASQASPGADIPLNEQRTEGYRAFANKIWNAARFLFMNIDRAPNSSLWLKRLSDSATARPVESQLTSLELDSDTPLETRWIVSRLSAVCAEVDRSLKNYRFDEAAASVYQFFWGDLCDWYLELVKLRLNFDGGENRAGLITLGAFINVFGAALRMLSPFMPFITEELWQALNEKLDEDGLQSIALTRYPQPSDYPTDPAAERDMTLLQDLIVTIRGLRKELGVPEKEETPIRIFSPDLTAAALATVNADMLAKMARVASVEVSPITLTGQGSRSTPRFDVQIVYERQIDVAAERERLTKDLTKYEKGLAAADRQLSNESFMAKAPAHIVEGLRKQSAETRILFDKTKAALEQLG